MKSKKGSIIKENKDGEVDKLRARIRRLETDNKRLTAKNKKLLSEIKTLEVYREVTTGHIGDKLNGIPVEKVVKSVEKKQKAKKESKEKEGKSKEACPVCYGPVKEIKFIAGKVKVCSNSKCKFRETVNEKK